MEWGWVGLVARTSEHQEPSLCRWHPQRLEEWLRRSEEGVPGSGYTHERFRGKKP